MVPEDGGIYYTHKFTYIGLGGSWISQSQIDLFTSWLFRAFTILTCIMAFQEGTIWS